MRTARREFLAAASGLGLAGLAGPLWSAEATSNGNPRRPAAAADQRRQGGENAAEISAAEDLMREHGLLRRVLLIYEDLLRRLRTKKEAAPAVFQQAATLVRKFVEDYHEKLEENFIFPLFENRRELVELVATLRKQHEAGRAITDMILRNATAQRLRKAETQEEITRLGRAFIRMYRPHAAREDTVLFPALHQLISAAEMDKLGDQFEEEENRLFGKEGFEHVVEQVAAVEKQLGIFDLDRFTPQVMLH